MTIDLASLQSQDGARRVFAGPGGGEKVYDLTRFVFFCPGTVSVLYFVGNIVDVLRLEGARL